MRWALLAILLICLSGCSNARNEVETVATARERAINTRDMSIYRSLLSPGYQDRGKDFQQITSELAANFRKFDTLAYRSLNRTITVSGNSATISGNYQLRVTVKGTPLALTGREDIQLRREQGGWKIVGGL